MRTSVYTMWVGTELIGVVAFTIFPLLHVLDRSRKAALFLIPGALYMIFYLPCMARHDASLLCPIFRIGQAWGGYLLEWVHLLLFVSFAFFAASPAIRWRLALRRRKAEAALAGEQEALGDDDKTSA